jgi:MraZ protein
LIVKYHSKLDAKYRLLVPAKLRSELGEDFYVTLGVNCGHRCLTVYTAKDWNTLVENYNNLPISQRSAATSLIFINANECTPDKQFRFMLNQFLLDYAGIGREVMVVGRAGQAEIWDAEEFARFEQENLTPEKLLASLEAIGL